MKKQHPLKPVKVDPAKPWFLICKEAARGFSLDGLSRRYNVPVDHIQFQLSRFIKEDGSLRTLGDINHASKRVHSDLVQTLEAMARDLAGSADKCTSDNLAKLNSLTVTAARLFAWPVARQIDGHSPASPEHLNPLSNAINLALIATTPDQLRKLADSDHNIQSSILSQPAQEPIPADHQNSNLPAGSVNQLPEPDSIGGSPEANVPE